MVKCSVKIFGIVLINLLSACGGDSDKKVQELKNTAPTAQIELDTSSIVLENSVTISGVLSHDAEGDILSYKWGIKTAAGDDYPLENNTVETLVFTPDNFGTYHVSLVVRDAELSSELVTAIITVEPNEQSYPIAMISDDISSKIGNVNWFSAENSAAANGQLLSYFWQLKSKPATSNSVIGDATNIKGYLIADAAGIYEVSLTVTNTENKLTATKELTIVAEELLTNSAPVAVISKPLTAYAPEQLVRLNATASYDSDCNDLTYQWRLEVPTSAQYVSLAGDTTEFVEFYVDGIGEYYITLEVKDGFLTNETTQTITVTDQNITPVANAGADQVIAVGEALVLDGAASSDADGIASYLSYQWSLVSKPLSSSYHELSNPSFASHSQFSFIADVTGEYVLALQVFDDIDYSTLDQVHIEVTENQRPVAILPDDVVVHTNGSQVVTNTQSYDPEGLPLTYNWQIVSVPEGSAGRILPPIDTEGVIIFTDFPGTYTFQLIVNDGIQNSLPATMSFIYAPEEFYQVTVSGQLVNEVGLPLTIAEIGGIFHTKVASDVNGNFEILLKSRNQDASLTIITLADKSILSSMIIIPETDESQMDIGTVKLPVLQSKDISLTACEAYTGQEKVTVHFFLSTEGYEDMRFIKPVVAELTIGQDSQAIKLPAKGVINMRLATSVSGQVYVNGGNTFFTHEYQVDDTQVDPLAISVCN